MRHNRLWARLNAARPPIGTDLLPSGPPPVEPMGDVLAGEARQ